MQINSFYNLYIIYAMIIIFCCYNQFYCLILLDVQIATNVYMSDNNKLQMRYKKHFSQMSITFFKIFSK